MIYFVEDDDNIRKLVCYALTRESFEVRGFAESCEFWSALSEELPELILLDIMLAGEDGLSILRRLRRSRRYDDVPIIMLTAKASEYDKVTGLDAGADDYIAKPFGMTELVSRVRAVMRRYDKTKSKASSEYKIGGLYVNTAKHIIRADGAEITLSYKEYSLLLALLEANGNVVTRDDLIAKVWGEYYEESRTLDVHIRKLRVKLGDEGRLIQTVKNIGYKLGDGNDE